MVASNAWCLSIDRQSVSINKLCTSIDTHYLTVPCLSGLVHVNVPSPISNKLRSMFNQKLRETATSLRQDDGNNSNNNVHVMVATKKTSRVFIGFPVAMLLP